MNDFVSDVFEEIKKSNPMHWKKLNSNVHLFDDRHHAAFDFMCDEFMKVMDLNGYSVTDVVIKYNEMLTSVLKAFIRYHRDGIYPNCSFSEVNARLYSNKFAVESFALASFLSEILWQQHFRLFYWYLDKINLYKSNIHSYLEIGGAHGQYMSYMERLIPEVKKTILSTNPVSDMMVSWFSSRFISYDSVKDLENIKYDWITLGETMEHYENPEYYVDLSIRHLNKSGYLFITAPVNAPAPDHVYHYKSSEEVLNFFENKGLTLLVQNEFFAESDRTKDSLGTKIFGAIFQLRQDNDI
jgi:hypothetical protein